MGRVVTYWLSRNEKGLVIGSGDEELIQFLTDDEALALRVKDVLNEARSDLWRPTRVDDPE
jgi:hypothetical protein